MLFYLGTHHPDWLARFDVPLFVSRRALAPMTTLPRARGTWALDSGGFTELDLHGRWTITAKEYAAQVRRFATEIGGMAWAAPQDWMVEDAIRAKTGLSIAEHQKRTVENLLELRAIAPEIPWTPVLQGWTEGDYLDHLEAYELAGVDLRAEPLVGVGSVCRRQSTIRIALLLAGFAADGLKLHGFGVKKAGLRAAAPYLASADSLAWSLNARKNRPIPGHTHGSCANCPEWALTWREELLASLPEAA